MINIKNSFFILLLFFIVACQEPVSKIIPSYSDLEKLNIKGNVKSILEVVIDEKHSDHSLMFFNRKGELSESGTWENIGDSSSTLIDLSTLKPFYYLEFHDSQSEKNIYADTIRINSDKKYNQNGQLVELLIYSDSDKDKEYISKKYTYNYKNNKLNEFKYYRAAIDTADSGYEQLNNGIKISSEYIDYMAWTNFKYIKFNQKGFPVEQIVSGKNKYQSYNKIKYDNYNQTTVKQTIYKEDKVNRNLISDNLILIPRALNDYVLEHKCVSYYLDYLNINADSLRENTYNSEGKLVASSKYYSTADDEIEEILTFSYNKQNLKEVKFTQKVQMDTDFNKKSSVTTFKANRTFNEQKDIVKLFFDDSYYIKNEVYTKKFIYKYDTFNNWIEKEEFSKNGNKLITKRKITYY